MGFRAFGPSLTLRVRTQIHAASTCGPFFHAATNSSTKRTDIIVETPGFCIVIPYNTSAACMVPLLCVITKNCVWSVNSRSSCVKRPTLLWSSGASTSSKTTNGLGLVFNKASIKVSAVKARSPPDNKAMSCCALPGGCTRNSTPVSSKLSGCVNDKNVWPPSKTRLNKLSKWSRTLSKVAMN